MIVTKKKLDKHLKFEIKIDNHVIFKKECIKYLGVSIDNDLDHRPEAYAKEGFRGSTPPH